MMLPSFTWQSATVIPLHGPWPTTARGKRMAMPYVASLAILVSVKTSRRKRLYRTVWLLFFCLYPISTACNYNTGIGFLLSHSVVAKRTDKISRRTPKMFFTPIMFWVLDCFESGWVELPVRTGVWRKGRTSGKPRFNPIWTGLLDNPFSRGGA